MVVIMMSTYNGEKYLEEQIESIINQQDIQFKLIIRDDGSTDNTLNIIKKYEEEKKCTLIKGKNVGPAKSFLELLYNAPEADYYAFADQDDVWFDNKVSVAISKLKKNQPALYHGFALTTDENLVPLNAKKYTPLNTFGGALVTSATGCTMVFNKELYNILMKYHPSYVSMHDAWVYRVAYAVGADVVYDSKSYMYYRQHSFNVTGGIKMSLSAAVRRVVRDNKNKKLLTAEQVLHGYESLMSKENLKILKNMVTYRKSILSKLKVVFGKDIVARSLKTTIQFKLLFLFNIM